MTSRALHSIRLLWVAPLLWVLGAAVPAAAADTSLRLIIPTNYPAGTREVLIAPADGTFTARYFSDGSIRVEFSNSSYTNHWSLGFAAANGQALAAGTYYDADFYYPRRIDRNGIEADGSGYGGCSSETGDFEVKQVVYGSNGDVARLWALFEARCPGIPPLRGEMRWNAEVGVAVTAPLDLLVDNGQTLVFPVRATSTAAGPISLSTIDPPPGATFVDNGDGTGRFDWTVHYDLPGPYGILFQARDSAGRTDSTSTRVVVRGVSSLLADSDPGDFVGNGELAFFTSDDGEFGTGFSSFNHAALTFGGLNFGPDWTLNFAAPPGEALAVGAYEGAVDYFQQVPGQPGLSIRGNGHSCSAATGRFEVKQISLDPTGRPASFRATFEQHCEGVTPALRGEIRFNANMPLVLRAPTHLMRAEEESLSFDVHGFDSLGSPVVLSATGLPSGALFTDQGDGSGRFEWTPAVGQAGVYTLAFEGVNDRGEADVVYTRIGVTLGFDDFDHPIRFSALPFQSTVEDTSSATAAADDPVCLGPAQATVWYAFTPLVDAPIYANTFANLYGAVLSVYQGVRGALTQVACGSRQVRFDAHMGQTYYIMAGTSSGLPITLSVDVAPPPPPNDDFDNATVVGTLPFSETLDTRSETPAADDPEFCANVLQPIATVWYTYTPVVDTRVTIDTTGSDYSRLVSVLTGTREFHFPLACDFYGLTFTAYAGHTYYLVIGSPFGIPGGHLVLSITGRTLLQIQAFIDPAGSFDPRTGTVSLHGTVTCSRPARIDLQGSVVPHPPATFETFEMQVMCDGTTAWSARVSPDLTRFRQGRYTGQADVFMHAGGAALDDGADFDETNVQSSVLLRAAPPGRPAPTARTRRTRPER